MKSERAKFEPSQKYLALEPSAFGAYFDVDEEPAEAAVDENGIAVVTISGPLNHHASWCWDNYEAIVERVVAAFEHGDCKAVVLRIDSPGGLVSGCTEATRKIQSLKKKHGKPVFAFADEMACSAAYELSCAADEIWLPDTGTVGSIGVICALHDTTEASKKYGVRVELITSGDRKADSYSDRPLTPEIIKVAQDRIDYYAGIFFDVVAKARGVSISKIAGLQAGVYQGNHAVAAGLADGVAGWDEFLAHVKGKIMGKGAGSKNESLAKVLSALIETSDDPKSLLEMLSKPAEPVSAKAKATPKADDDEEEETDSTAASTKDSTDASTDAKAEEKSFFSASTGLYTPKRLVRLCRQVTGETGSIKSLFGAIDALGQQKKAAEKSAARIEKLEARQLGQDVDSMLASAKADGRITRAQVDHLRESGMKDPKFLKGFLSQLPKQIHTREDALVPRQDVDGQPVGTLSEAQRKIINAATAGMSATEKADFVAKMNSNSKLNGAAKAPLT